MRPRREVSAQEPLFLLYVDRRRHPGRHEEVGTIWTLVPDDLKPYAVFLLNGPLDDPAIPRDVEEGLDRCGELGIPAAVCYQDGWIDRVRSVLDEAWLERMYETYPLFVGPFFVELHGEKYDMVARAIRQAARHGGYVLNAEYLNACAGMIVSHRRDDMLRAMRDHPENYIILPKQTTNSQYMETEALAFGLWTSGLAGHWGPAMDSWAWWETGRGRPFAEEPGYRKGDEFKCPVSYPESQYSMMMLQSALAGATVFFFEHPFYCLFLQGTTTPCFDREIVPTMRMIVEKRLIPEREQVLGRVRAGLVVGAGMATPESSLPEEEIRTSLYYSWLYADRTNRDWLHKSGRYFTVPLLLGADAAGLHLPANLLDLETYRHDMSDEQRRAYFDCHYPKASDGDAFALEVPHGRWYFHNSFENTDREQRARIAGGTKAFAGIEVTLPACGYALLETGETALWLRLGNYVTRKDAIWDAEPWTRHERLMEWVTEVYTVNPDESWVRSTTVLVACAEGYDEPRITVVGVDGYHGFAHDSTWDAGHRELRLTVRHNGSVDVAIEV